MVYFHAGLELAGHDTHKRDTVAVCLIHVCLDLEDKRGEIVVKRTDFSCDRLSRQRGGCHLQEMLQESLDTEVGQCGTEKYRG